MENKDQPAYPLVISENGYSAEGLTKRELIAAMCLQGLMADGAHEFRETHKERIAHLAIVHADELLAQLEKPL